jgi:hypothetical protein
MGEYKRRYVLLFVPWRLPHKIPNSIGSGLQHPGDRRTEWCVCRGVHFAAAVVLGHDRADDGRIILKDSVFVIAERPSLRTTREIKAGKF